MTPEEVKIELLEELIEYALNRAVDQERNMILGGQHYTYRDLLRFYQQMAQELEDKLGDFMRYPEHSRRSRSIRDRVWARRQEMRKELLEKYGVPVEE